MIKLWIHLFGLCWMFWDTHWIDITLLCTWHRFKFSFQFNMTDTMQAYKFSNNFTNVPSNDNINNIFQKIRGKELFLSPWNISFCFLYTISIDSGKEYEIWKVYTDNMNQRYFKTKIFRKNTSFCFCLY